MIRSRINSKGPEVYLVMRLTWLYLYFTEQP